MSFTSILLLIFLVAAILIIGGLIKRKVQVKKIFTFTTIMFVLISCIIFSVYQYSQRSSSLIFTKTTNLSDENIGELQLYENIDNKGFTKRYGTNLERIDNSLFDYYKLSDGLIIAVNKDRQIIRIIKNNESDHNIKTNKGIGLGNVVDEVIKVYGKDYYKRMSDFGVPIIGYVDKNKKVTIEFFNYQNEVTEIRYDIMSIE
ncbi:hypothetical protein [Pelosinus baikalensis]|uniref:Uncharacterized protein n=1 Tax=Pelosinus baikalensis TaxID=2892015 RepID=A0ABS8HNH7_9FIRM|nr:hypothetical protein [Pelosinus baikalensis]MCC5464735.1 hypothetical protein [Pelosinus baikalensis]